MRTEKSILHKMLETLGAYMILMAGVIAGAIFAFIIGREVGARNTWGNMR